MSVEPSVSQGQAGTIPEPDSELDLEAPGLPCQYMMKPLWGSMGVAETGRESARDWTVSGGGDGSSYGVKREMRGEADWAGTLLGRQAWLVQFPRTGA